MTLKVQVITLMISFFYGFLFSFFITRLYRWIQGKKRYIQYSITIIFVLLIAVFYFYILRKINYGVIHPYALLSILVGYSLEHLIHLHFLTPQ